MSNIKVKVYQDGFPTEASVMTGRVIKIMPATAGEPWYELQFNEQGQLIIQSEYPFRINAEGSNHISLEFRQSE